MNWRFIRKVGYWPWAIRTFRRQLRKRLLHAGCSMTLPTGLEFFVPPHSHIGSEVFLTDADVDWGAEALLARLVSEDIVFLDVGANIGYYSVYMHPLVAAVHAFEPDQRALPSLRQVAAGLPRLTIHEAAVSSVDGTAVLTAGTSCELSMLVRNHGEGVKVRTIAIDTLASEIDGRIGAIKVDTEGHEAEVLAGADRTIARDRPVLLCETSPDESLLAWAAVRGYRVGAPVELSGPRLAFRWFSRPATLATKMVFLVPEARVPVLDSAAVELYGQGLAYGDYRPRLRAFRNATHMACGRIAHAS
jgi:FkbM family methyltransferase